MSCCTDNLKGSRGSGRKDVLTSKPVVTRDFVSWVMGTISQDQTYLPGQCPEFGAAPKDLSQSTDTFLLADGKRCWLCLGPWL